MYDINRFGASTELWETKVKLKRYFYLPYKGMEGSGGTDLLTFNVKR
jgi:hypothetical protein